MYIRLHWASSADQRYRSSSSLLNFLHVNQISSNVSFQLQTCRILRESLYVSVPGARLHQRLRGFEIQGHYNDFTSVLPFHLQLTPSIGFYSSTSQQ